MKRWPTRGLRRLLRRPARPPAPDLVAAPPRPPPAQDLSPAPRAPGADTLPHGPMQRQEGAIQAQRDFVADAAHALRSPLTALKLQLQLAERANDPVLRAAAFAKVHERLDRANHLVHQLLTLAHHERVPGAHDATADLARLAERVVIEYAALAASRHVDLGLVGADRACPVPGDSDQLAILLSNLVDNALRHTPPGGRVDVHLHADPQGPLLQVCDSGPGVPPEERERVFDRFYRGSGAAGIGSGLGLAIVRVIADSHGARVTLGDAASGGLRVDVRFGAAGPATPD